MATPTPGRKMSFRWNVNEVCTVYVHNETPEWTDANLVLDCFITDRPNDGLKLGKPSKVTYAQVPLPSYGQTDAVGILQETFRFLMKTYVDSNRNKMAVPIDDLKSWTKRKFCTAILTEFLRHANSRDPEKTSKITLSFCAVEAHNFDEAMKVCETARSEGEISQSSRMQRISITVERGSLDKTKADVLACTVSVDLDLKRGAVSDALLKGGGHALQTDLYDRCPRSGLPFDEIVAVHGHNLDCKRVFFGVMCPIDREYAKMYTTPEEYYRASVNDFVTICLKTAEERQFKSIAFPAVGAGILQYPVDIVADQMFETVINWSKTLHPVYLKDVRFVIYPTDTHAFETFQEAEKSFGANSRRSLLKTTEIHMKNPHAPSRCSKDIYRILTPKGYTPELIQLYCRDTIDHLKANGCDVEFKGDVILVRGPSDVLATEGVQLRDTIKKTENAFPASECLDLTQSNFNLGDVSKKIEEIKSSLNVQCVLNQKKTKLGFFGKSWQDVIAAKDKIVGLLLPPRKTGLPDSSKHVQPTPGAGGNSSVHHNHSGSNWNKSFPKYTEVVFETKEKITVKVYTADILSLPVDCIVNAANINLDHGGGIARAIAKAAGKDLTKDGCGYLKTNGKLRVGEACSTSAGKMNYKYVVHAVGPCWSDYKPYTLKDVEKCETDLYNAVINSLGEAERKIMQTVAVSSISSGKYGCPLDLCSVQYARAVLDYSYLAKSPLKEIHFVDTNMEMVQTIQATFQSMIPDEKVPKFYNKLDHVKSLGSGATKMTATEQSLKSQGNGPSKPGNRKGSFNSKTVYSGNKSQITMSTAPGYPYECKEQPPGHHKGSFTCYLGPEQKVFVYSSNLLTLQGIDMIACGEVPKGNGKGKVSLKILEMGGYTYKTEKEKAFKSNPKPGDVVFCKGGNSNFKWIGHAVLEKWKSATHDELQAALYNIFGRLFDGMLKYHCPSLALPLLGTGTGKGDPQSCAERLLNSLIKFCSRNKSFQFTIHLVHMEKDKTGIAIDVIKRAIKREAGVVPSRSFVHSQKQTSTRQSYSDRGKPPERPKSAPFRPEAKHPKRFDHSHDPRRSNDRDRNSTNSPQLFHNSRNQRMSPKKQYDQDRCTSEGRSYDPNQSKNNQQYSQQEEETVPIFRRSFSDNSDTSRGRRYSDTCRDRRHSSNNEYNNSDGNSNTDENEENYNTGEDSDTVGKERHNNADGISKNSDTNGNEKDRIGNVNIIEEDKQLDSARSVEPGNSEEMARSMESTDSEDLASSVEPAKSEEPGRSVEASKSVEQDKSNESDDDEIETCVICMEDITTPKRLPCGHTFCSDCIEEQFTYKEACPTCGKVCGIIKGDQPEGTMNIYVNKAACCVGYEHNDRIEIAYRFPDGIQESYHPVPGKRYKGISRTAYLPSNKQGKRICEMLKVAFERKLVFTIGSSRTTGAEGVITWNDIHHKTDPKPNTQFGYPDPTYLDRVTEELEVKGVTERDIPTPSAPRRRNRRR